VIYTKSFDDPDGSASAVHPPAQGPAPRDAEHDAFYAELVSRNDGFVSARAQERLRRARLLIAGCGSVGGAVIELLARMGAERFVLADPEGFDLTNCNRQHADCGDLGLNKAACFRRKILKINPHAEVRVEQQGVTAGNVAALVEASDLVVDGVEVVVDSARTAKCLLHLEAFRRRRPVVAGADVATTAMVRCYDYRRSGARYYNGLFSESQIGRIGTTQFLTRDIPLRIYPLEMFAEVERLLAGKPHFSQLGPTAQLLGAMMAQAIVDILEGKRVRELTSANLPALFRIRRRSLAAWFSRMRAALRCLRLFRRVRKLGEAALPSWSVGRQGRAPEPPPLQACWRRTVGVPEPAEDRGGVR